MQNIVVTFWLRSTRCSRAEANIGMEPIKRCGTARRAVRAPAVAAARAGCARSAAAVLAAAPARRAGPRRCACRSCRPGLKGSIGEGPNQTNYSDRSSVRILGIQRKPRKAPSREKPEFFQNSGICARKFLNFGKFQQI